MALYPQNFKHRFNRGAHGTDAPQSRSAFPPLIHHNRPPSRAPPWQSGQAWGLGLPFSSQLWLQFSSSGVAAPKAKGQGPATPPWIARHWMKRRGRRNNPGGPQTPSQPAKSVGGCQIVGMLKGMEHAVSWPWRRHDRRSSSSIVMNSYYVLMPSVHVPSLLPLLQIGCQQPTCPSLQHHTLRPPLHYCAAVKGPPRLTEHCRWPQQHTLSPKQGIQHPVCGEPEALGAAMGGARLGQEDRGWQLRQGVCGLPCCMGMLPVLLRVGIQQPFGVSIMLCCAVLCCAVLHHAALCSVLCPSRR
jgi:hypothetical protein